MRARDRVTETEVFLQLPGALKDTERALREARTLARVQHQGLIRLLHVIETGPGPVLVLEPFPTRTLEDVFRERGLLDAREVAQLGAGIAHAVHALHAQGIVHRNIGASSIHVGPDGSTAVGGFRLAKPRNLQGLSSINYADERDRSPAALPEYPAPELWLGHAADARSDVFSIGGVLWRALTGEVSPPTAAGPGGPAPGADRPTRALHAILARCLDRSPTARFSTATELATALEEITATAEAHATTGPAPSRRLVISGIALTAAVVIGLTMAFDFGSWFRTRDPGGNATPTPRLQRSNAPFSSSYHASHALVIGIDYRGNDGGWQTLGHAANDAEKLSGALTDLGWKVQTLRNEEASEEAIERALRQLGGLDPDDQVLVYYAGHGIAHPNSNRSGYVVASDAGKKGSGPVPTNCIPFSTFENVFKECSAKHILLAFDCCHSGAAVMRGDPIVASSKGPGLPGLDKHAHLVLTSSRADQLAADESVFAKTILDLLAGTKNGSGPFSANKLHAELQDRMRHLPGQNPLMTPFAETQENIGQFWFQAP